MSAVFKELNLKDQTELLVLEETFDNVQGIYLDQGTSLFETLAGITAEQASIPVGGRCATLAAQVRHVAIRTADGRKARMGAPA